MNKKIILPLLVVSGMLLFGCSSNSPYQPEEEMVPPSTDLARFSKIQEIVFEQSCAFSGCHGGANPKADLNLEAGQAYNNLVDVDSRENPQMKRVDPGDPENSLLILKLTGQNTSLMPPGGPAISQSMLDSIRQWIALGAENN
ncbi:MAG: hypothetical protein Kow0037_21720 [Calditrichia bacterium]